MNRIGFHFHENVYKDIIGSGDERKLWAKINWSGRLKDSAAENIPIQVKSNYFEKLYQPLDIDEKREMEELQSNIYIQ